MTSMMTSCKLLSVMVINSFSYIHRAAPAEVSVDQEIRAVVLDSEFSAGGNVTFVCSAFGAPERPVAMWQFIRPGGTTAMPLPESITPVVTEIGSANLTSAITIQDIRFRDRGVYRCSVGTSVYDEVRLVVAGK